MKLAQFIQTNMEHLLEDWEVAAIEVVPSLQGQESGVLRDHARSMLEFISEDLVTPQTNDESARKALGKGESSASLLRGDGDHSAGNDSAGNHGTGRLRQGFSMLEMIQELQALRARVTLAWSKEQKGLAAKDIDELVRFNEAVDQLIARSVSSYSELKERETRLFETMLKASLDPGAIFGLDGRLLFLNSAMADLVDTTPLDAAGKTPLELGLEFSTDFDNEIARTINTGLSQRGEFYCRLPSGLELYLDSQLVPVFDDHSNVEAVVKTSRDITDRRKADQEAWRSANLDSLTGIPNRRLFIDRLEHTLHEAERNNGCFALLFIDLDRFKQANDQVGHEAGDRLLGLVAERINNSVRTADTLARLGGDEFTLILKDTGREGAREAARALLVSLEQAFNIDSHQVHISGSIGLTFFPDHGLTVGQLMHNADQAMYTAKAYGGQQVQIYESSMAQSESEHMRLNRELNDAIRGDQLEVYFQPIIDIRTGAISRAEALLRWNHPYRGLLSPEAFLSVTEQSGMTDDITAFVLEQAVICSLRWRDLHDEPFPININESPASFVTRSLVDKWRSRLTLIGLDESQITMELTPGSITNILASGFNPVRSLGLKGLRLHLSVDDFGIEPFSLSALQEFGMESIKIDRELIKDAGKGGDADQTLEAIIAMAHSINVEVIGVGVESFEQLKFLTRVKCDYAQGFLFSQPLNMDGFEELLRLDRQINPS